MKHMVKAIVGSGGFQLENVLGLFHHADDFRIAMGVLANMTKSILIVGVIETVVAEFDLRLDHFHAFTQVFGKLWIF